MELPAPLVKNLRAVHADADLWIARLPALLRDLEARWRVRVAGLVPRLNYNLVAFAVGEDGMPYILKACPPYAEFDWEARALELYGGRGICRLIRADTGAAALLLERVFPGVSLWENPDEEENTRIAATLMRQLWRPAPPSGFEPLESWSRALPEALRAPGSLPRDLLKRANDLRLELLQSPEAVLLHADLHHDNILTATRAPYLAIDPKGITGPRGYDVGPFLENPIPELSARPDIGRVLERRVGIFSEMLDLEAREVAAWGFVHAALSACWFAEDGGDGWGPSLKVAEVLMELG
jgi:streptomycin 6-kinase